MTQQEFDTLPGLLNRSRFMQATGLTAWKLRSEVEAGVLQRWKPGAPRSGRKKSYALYYKADAARIGGFQMK